MTANIIFISLFMNGCKINQYWPRFGLAVTSEDSSSLKISPRPTTWADFIYYLGLMTPSPPHVLHTHIDIYVYIYILIYRLFKCSYIDLWQVWTLWHLQILCTNVSFECQGPREHCDITPAWRPTGCVNYTAMQSFHIKLHVSASNYLIYSIVILKFNALTSDAT